MEGLFENVRRFGHPATGLLALFVALAPSTTQAMEPPLPDVPPSPEQAEGLDAKDAVIAALHRQGEHRYADDDYTGAREAWLDAYERVMVGPETNPYRVTLLSLITNATLADYAITGAQQPLRRTEQLLVGALELETDPALRALLEEQLDQLRPFLKTEQPSAPPADPVVLEPAHPPSEDAPASVLHPASTPLLIVGSVTMAGGLAMIGAGAAFGWRAQGQVPDDDDSRTGRDFIADERRKGYVWIGAGAGTAALGVALVVSGAVLRARSRRAARQATVLLPIRGGAALTLTRRF